MRPDLNKLSKEIYEANKLKGWHDQEYSNEHYLCLVISELMEAVEADRKGRIFENQSVTNDFDHFERKVDKIGFVKAFEEDIKDTVSDELADAVIRLLDLAGVRKINIQSSYVFSKHYGIVGYSFTEKMLYAVRIILSDLYEKINKTFSLYANINEALSLLNFICEEINIDLWQHVELKLQYNKSRPIKHGKRY